VVSLQDFFKKRDAQYSRKYYYGTRFLIALIIALWAGVHIGQANVQASSRSSLWTLFEQEQSNLISNNIGALLADGDMIWVGTDRGISRFDGVWTSYPSADPALFVDEDKYTSQQLAHQVPPGKVVALTQGREPGQIWMATDTGYIAYWDGDGWNVVVNIKMEPTVLLSLSGYLLIGTPFGLIFYDNEQNDIRQIARVEQLGNVPIHAMFNAGATVFVGTATGLLSYNTMAAEWTREDIRGLDSQEITALWKDKNGRLWVGTPVGTYWRDEADEEWTYLKVIDRHAEAVLVQTLVGDADGNVWAGTEGGGARKFMDGGNMTIDVAYASHRKLGDLTTPLVRSIAIDQDGSIWFGTPIGVFRYQENRWLNVYSTGENTSPFTNYINDLLNDSNNTLWAATGGAGVFCKVKTKFGFDETLFNTENSALPSNLVYVLSEDAQGNVWAGTTNGIARYTPTQRDKDTHLKGQWSIPVPPEDLPSHVIYSLAADENQIWIGTLGGLTRFHYESERIISEPTFEGKSVVALAHDTFGNLWANTFQDGIWRQNQQGQWEPVPYTTTSPNEFTETQGVFGSLAPDPLHPGHMWAIVENHGLIRWDGARWQDGDPQDKLPSSFLYRLFSSPEDKSLWIGGQGGASRYDGQSWQTFNQDDGLKSASVFGIARTQEGHYWFGSSENGLSYYQPEYTEPWIQLTHDESEQVVVQGIVHENLSFPIEVGDLQEDQIKLTLFYRVLGYQDHATKEPSYGIDQWREFKGNYLSFDRVGEYTLEFRVRDQSFNYSDIVQQQVVITPPPMLFWLPWLGEVAPSIFALLTLLGSSAFLGMVYTGFTLVKQRRRLLEAVNRSYNPYVSGEPVRREDMFFGRHWLVQRIVDTLHNNSIMIHGERRIGKTTLLYQLSHVLSDVKDDEFWFLPIYIDLEGTEQQNFFHFLIEELALTLTSNPDVDQPTLEVIRTLNFHGIESNRYTDRHFNRDLRRMITCLNECSKRRHAKKQVRLILLMDEMDVISQYDHLIQQQLRRIFMRDFASTLGAVVAGIQISREWDRIESPWYNLFNEIRVEPFSRNQAEELLIEPVRDYYTYRPEAIDFIIGHSDGRPFRLQQYALEAVNHMLSKRRRWVKLEDVQFAHAIIENSKNHYHGNNGLFKPVPMTI